MKKFAALLLIASFWACSEKEITPAPSNTEMISESSWKYESGGADLDRNGSIDVTFESTGAIPACRLDNTATFSANGSGIADEGTTKCNASDPQSLPFTWNFSNNETKLNITGPGVFGISGQFNLVALSRTRLTLSKDTTISSVNASVIVNLKH
jgi:hypothetical protein